MQSVPSLQHVFFQRPQAYGLGRCGFFGVQKWQVKKLKEFKQKSVYAHNHRPYLDSQIYSSQSGHLEVQKLLIHGALCCWHGEGLVTLNDGGSYGIYGS